MVTNVLRQHPLEDDALGVPRTLGDLRQLFIEIERGSLAERHQRIMERDDHTYRSAVEKLTENSKPGGRLNGQPDNLLEGWAVYDARLILEKHEEDVRAA
jgi:hypothetical protein